LLGGFLAGQDVMSPEAVAMAMTAGGAIGAYTMDGRARVAAHGVAAAGAGQLALSLMARRDTAKATTEAAKAAAARRAPSAPPGDGAPPNGVPARQGYGRAPLFNRVAHAASSVRNQLAYVDAFDDDGYDDAAFDLD
ncbi:MAG: hypothetical protein KC464_18280, partial [Myxococcales bacterium]|nr:hypothetical protein [Myxococcales bacterium]